MIFFPIQWNAVTLLINRYNKDIKVTKRLFLLSPQTHSKLGKNQEIVVWVATQDLIVITKTVPFPGSKLFFTLSVKSLGDTIQRKGKLPQKDLWICKAIKLYHQ